MFRRLHDTSWPRGGCPDRLVVEVVVGPFFQGGDLGAQGNREPKLSLGPRQGTASLGTPGSLLSTLALLGLVFRPRGLRAHLASYLLKGTWALRAHSHQLEPLCSPGPMAGCRSRPKPGNGPASQLGFCFSDGPCSDRWKEPHSLGQVGLHVMAEGLQALSQGPGLQGALKGQRPPWEESGHRPSTLTGSRPRSAEEPPV